jgi:hypothetical protein
MPGIYVMAIVTILGAVLLWGTFLYLMSGHTRRYLWLMAVAVALSAMVNLAVKRPLAVTVGQWGSVEPGLGIQTPLWFIVFLSLLPPITEEAIKVIPLLVPRVRAMVKGPASALWVGMGLGISFGIGEAAYLAYGVGQSPQYGGLPWYLFTGYLGERITVCFIHGVLTGVVVSGISRGIALGITGYLAAAGLHLLVNLSPILLQLKLIEPWAVTPIFAVALIVVALAFERLRRSASRDEGESASAEEVVYFRR